MVMEAVADLELAVEEPDQEKKQEEGQDNLRDQKVKWPRRRVRARSD